MNIKRLAWIVPEEWLPLMNSQGGVSSCYTIPVNLLSSVEDISGATIFIVARGKSCDFLFARIVVDSVDIALDDEGAKAGYVLNINLEKSLRFARLNNEEDVNSFRIPNLLKIEFGFTHIEEKEIKLLEGIVKKHFKFLFTPVPVEQLARINPPFQQCGSLIAPIVVLKEVVSKFSLTEMWGGRKNPHPVVNFACHYLESHPEFLTSGTVADCVKTLNAFPWLQVERIGKEEVSQESTKQDFKTFQLADVSLVPINPRDVKVRHFVANETSVSKESLMRKTEAAELRHQNMLRDIATYFQECGVTPYQSNSIDLAIKANGATDIFELKSISETNLVAQSSKGIFQLLYYSFVLHECGVLCGSKNLVLEAGNSNSDLAIVAAIVASAGVRLVVYDVRKEWPHRLSVFSKKTTGDMTEFLFNSSETNS